MEKICSKCKQQKSYSMFYADVRKSDGLQSQCKNCFKNYREKNFKQRKDYMELWRKNNQQQIKSYTKKYYEENCEQIKNVARKHYYDNLQKSKARMKARYWEDPQKNIARSKKWKKDNPGKVNAKTAERRIRQVQATPAWANLKAIEREYELAAWCSNVMGEPYHVDHVIPLKGNNVCGLHIETNLQVIRGTENVSKSNKFEVL